MSSTINQNNLINDVVIDVGDSITASGALSYVDKSIRRINRKLNLSGNSAVAINASGVITAPNDNVIDILALQIECLIVKTNQANTVSKGIKIKSGDDSVDTTASFGGYKAVVNSVCGELNKAINRYRYNASESDLVDSGKVIWYGDQRGYWEDEDYYDTRKNFDSEFDDGTEQD